MPQSTQRLRNKFMQNKSDGIQKASDIITKAGGTIEDFYISYTGTDKEVWDAIEFLCDEWDFGYNTILR